MAISKAAQTSQLVNEYESVTWYGADNSGTTDSTAAITAAWTAASATLDAETIVYWPAGTYLVTQLDYTGINSVKNVALGTVVILGTDNTSTYSFIVGCDGYDAGTPANSTFTRRHHWDGRFIINPQDTGRTYTTGMRLYAAVECYMTDCSVAGNFATNTVDLQYSFSNRWFGGSIGNSNDGSGGTVYGLECQNNNVNNNTLANIRFSGTNDATEAQVLARINGTGNILLGCDISAAREGVRVDNSRSTLLLNNYFEATLYPVTCGNESVAPARGISVIGGYMEILTNGVGITTGVGSFGCQGFDISGVAFKGLSGGSSRTAVDLGSQSYHVTITSPDYADIDTDITGTVRAGGSLGQQLIGGAIQISDSGALSTFESTTMGNTSVTGGSQYMSFEGFGNVGFFISSATPEGNITAGVGSLCLRANGGAGTTLYVKESGTGNTGWVGK